MASLLKNFNHPLKLSLPLSFLVLFSSLFVQADEVRDRVKAIQSRLSFETLEQEILLVSPVAPKDGALAQSVLDTFASGYPELGAQMTSTDGVRLKSGEGSWRKSILRWLKHVEDETDQRLVGRDEILKRVVAFDLDDGVVEEAIRILWKSPTMELMCFLMERVILGESTLGSAPELLEKIVNQVVLLDEQESPAFKKIKKMLEEMAAFDFPIDEFVPLARVGLDQLQASHSQKICRASLSQKSEPKP